MIIQALCDYYQRKAADPESGIAPEGFERKEIPFVVVIDKKGNFVELEDTREGEGKKKRAKAFLIPQAEKKTVGIKANLLWDTVEYALGANPRRRKDVNERHAAFVARIREELPDGDPRKTALVAFLEKDPPTVIERSKPAAAVWAEALESNANVLFRLDGDVHTDLCSAFFQYLTKSQSNRTTEGRTCLATGDSGRIARIHPSIKGVRGAQSSGAALVSFNKDAYASFGKTQNFNAPLSESASFAYTTALNSLLARDSRNKVQLGDATVVFWSQRPTTFESQFAAFFAGPDKDDPDRDVNAVRSLYDSLHSGAGIPQSESLFFVLGLSPNAARISVRFWQTATVAQLAERIRQHFDDLEIVRGAKDEKRYALFWLLSDLATEHKVDNVPPNLAGDLTRAVLSGGLYPQTLVHQAVRRIRAERHVSRMRAAILKAVLNRFHRIHPATEKEITVALDLNNQNPAYRLGRLFAVLEKIQEDAQPGLNATIRDRFYGAASASPVTVFPRLLKLAQHHQAKVKGDKPGFAVNNDKWLSEIIGGLPPAMPAQLAMEDQARFAIGYYHQRQALFSKSTQPDS